MSKQPTHLTGSQLSVTQWGDDSGPNSRTFIPEEQPDLLATAIEDFLAAQVRTE